ncbi:MAG: ribonuclease HI [Epsilonproteobacteria bacterium]|nr:ribonuclease HI [Campylobacterota bacterium]
MKKVTIFTDGACLGNPGAGGWCALLRYKGHEKILKGSKENTTNNQMELKAVIEALKALKFPCEVEIYSDSTYVVKGINQWLQNWVKKDFKNVKNPDLWREYLEVSKGHKIKLFWIKGHNNHRENEICDKIARKEAKRIEDANN